MGLKKKKTKQRIVLPRGIDENEFMNLYRWSVIKRIKPEEVLIKEGTSDQIAYFILSGKILISKKIKGKLEHLDVLGKGDWVGEIALIKKTMRTATALAIEPSVVMGITLDTLNAVDEKTQLVLYKHLADLSASRIDLLEAKGEALSAKNNALTNNLLNQRLQNKIDVSESELILGIIKKIPRLPTFAQTLTLNALGDDISTTKVAMHIKQDPSFAGVVLKIINSAYYGFQGKISDIHRAVILLGYDKLNQLILSEGIRQAMPKKPIFQELHTHALAISQIAFIISQNSRKGDPALVATFGLLHDLGKTVIEFLKNQNPKLSVFVNALDSAQLGAMLFAEWNFSDFLCRCTKYQFYPEFSPPTKMPKEVLDTVTIVYLAHLCYDFFIDEADAPMPPPFLDEYLKMLNWEGLSIAEIINEHVLSTIQEELETYPAPLKKLFGELELR